MDAYLIAEVLKAIDRKLAEQNNILRELIEALQRRPQ